MIAIVLAALFGGLASAAVMISFGATVAVFAMPIGGSLTALAVAVLLGIRNEAARVEREAFNLPDSMQHNL